MASGWHANGPSSPEWGTLDYDWRVHMGMNGSPSVRTLAMFSAASVLATVVSIIAVVTWFIAPFGAQMEDAKQELALLMSLIRNHSTTSGHPGLAARVRLLEERADDDRGAIREDLREIRALVRTIAKKP